MPLYNQKIFEKEIEKIPDKDKNKIKNIHLAAVEIIIKAYFREEIDTPIKLLLCDDRITYPDKGSLIDTLIGNLIYQQVKFTKIINYSISVQDKNLNKSLVLYWDLKGIEMVEGSKLFSIRLRNLYVLSDKHIIKNKKQYKGNIIIEPLFQDVIQNNNNKFIEYEKPRKSFDQEQMRTYSKRYILPDQAESSTSGNNDRILNIPEIKVKQRINTNQFHIIGKIAQGKYKNYYPILIDTGAAASYISSSIIAKEGIGKRKLGEPIRSKNYSNKLNIYSIETELNIELTDVNDKKHTMKFIGLVDTIQLLEEDIQQILIGIDILQQVSPYEITNDFLKFTLQMKPIQVPRIKKDIYTISKELEQMNLLNE